MKKVLTRILSGVLLCALLTTGAAAATLQSGQAAYQLSLDPLGTEPFSYSDTETYSATLVPIGTRVSSETGALLLVEIFTYSESSGHWALNSLLSGQSDLVVRDSAHLYHVSTLSGSGQSSETLDRGIWLKAPSSASGQPVSATGEPVDEWALNLVNQAIAGGLMPDHLKGQDLREPITRLQFAALTVRLYETASGQSIQVPGENPFTDTSDSEALKAYSMGFTAGTSPPAPPTPPSAPGNFSPGSRPPSCSPLFTGPWAAPFPTAPPPSQTAGTSPPGPKAAWPLWPRAALWPATATAASVPRTPPSGRPASSWPCASSRIRPHNRAGLSPPVPPRHRRPAPLFSLCASVRPLIQAGLFYKLETL